MVNGRRGGRQGIRAWWPLVLVVAAGCGTRASVDSAGSAAPLPAALSVEVAQAQEQAIARVVRVTGTLKAQEEAEVAAEIAGRITATPVESGTLVSAGQELVRIASAEVEAQAREAEANVAQIEARLGIPGGRPLEVERVPEVANARAAADQAQADFDRIKALVDKKLVSQAEFDQRRTQTDAARRQYEIARNGVDQQYQTLLAARARLALAAKALSDAVVRAPFTGIVAERLVSTGDFVTRGTKVATVVQVNPLRLELTVPEQSIASVTPGGDVVLEVDAYPGRTFTGRVRYVSPGLRADSRALVVQAVVPNPDGMLKPGFFASARLAGVATATAILVPAAAVRSVAGSARVFAVSGDHVEERIVTTGQVVGDRIEIATGLKAGETVAVTQVGQLTDGTRVVAKS